MYKKVLITGSCGFVFSNFIRKAIYEKYPYQFVSIDRVNSKNVNSIYWNKNHSFHVADITDAHIIDVIFQFERPDIVFHGAAECLNQSEFIKTNVIGTQNIIEACLNHKVEKLVYMSTGEVYGHAYEDSESWQEEDAINPTTQYSVSKAAGEMLVKEAHTSQGLIYNIIRGSSSYGPRQSIEKLIPKTIKKILNNEKILVYGQGTQLRDWIHIFDECTALLTILKNGESNQTYNISANQTFNTLEVVQKICNTIGKGHDSISFTEPPIGCIFKSELDNRKVKKLNWEPKYKFKEGVIETVEWYLNNQWALK